MVKGSTSKDFRYHRVDLSKKFAIDEEDSDSELERELGPPTRRGTAGSTALASDSKCSSVLRSGCIAFTVIVTLAGLAAVMIYSSILFPLIGQNHFGFFDGNSTLSPTTTITPTNSSSEYETTVNSSQSTNGPEKTQKTTALPSHLPQTTSLIDKNSTMRNSGETDHGVEDFQENSLQKNPSNENFLESGFYKPRMLAENMMVESKLKDFANFLENREDISDEVLTTQKSDWDPSNIRLDRDIFGNEEEDEDELIESGKVQSNGSSQLTMQNQTVVENESSVFNLTTLYRESHANQTTYSQTIKEFAKNVWMEYRKNDTYVLASFGILVTLLILILIGCFICRQRARKQAKKRHFKRLINDLNATEKFSIITPSEEEDLSD